MKRKDKSEPWEPCGNCGVNPWSCLCDKPDYSKAIAQVRRAGIGLWVSLGGGRRILENRSLTQSTPEEVRDCAIAVQVAAQH